MSRIGILGLGLSDSLKATTTSDQLENGMPEFGATPEIDGEIGNGIQNRRPSVLDLDCFSNISTHVKDLQLLGKI